MGSIFRCVYQLHGPIENQKIAAIACGGFGQTHGVGGHNPCGSGGCHGGGQRNVGRIHGCRHLVAPNLPTGRGGDRDTAGNQDLPRRRVDLRRPGSGPAQEVVTGSDLPQPVQGNPPADQQVAALPSQLGESELYAAGTDLVRAGDYGRAEAHFREFTERYGSSSRAPDAAFWLGESILSQGRYEEAAKVFLDTHKRFPEGRMAAQNLLKLGVSLAGMNQRELACATLAEVPRKYPDLSAAVRDRVAAEQKAASCKNR